MQKLNKNKMFQNLNIYENKRMNFHFLKSGRLKKKSKINKLSKKHSIQS